MSNSRSASFPRAVAALVSAFAALAACSASPPSDGSTVAATSEAMTSGGSTCPMSETFGLISFVAPDAPVACAPVPGWGGDWVGSDEYPAQACAATRDPSRGVPVFCTYAWTPWAWWPSAAADVGALQAIPDVYVAPFGNGGETTCSDPSSLPHAALLDDAGVSCPPRPHHPDGAAPCTVCDVGVSPGVHRGVLAMAATSTLHTVAVELSNGTRQIVTFDASAQARSRGRSADYLEVPLPALAAGLRYVDGPAGGYGYARQHP